MRSNFLPLTQAVISKFLTICLVVLLGVSSVITFAVPPVYATTLEEEQLIPPEYQPTPEERINRAYDQSEAAGVLEEMKQQSGQKNEKFDPNKRANSRTIPDSKTDPETGLVDKAQKLVNKVTGKL